MMEKLLLFGELGRGTAIRNVAPDLRELVTIKTKMLQMVKQTLHQELSACCQCKLNQHSKSSRKGNTGNR